MPSQDLGPGIGMDEQGRLLSIIEVALLPPIILDSIRVRVPSFCEGKTVN